MRRVSKQRRELMKRVKPIRDALIANYGACMICGHQYKRRMKPLNQLCCHEIAGGPLRAKSLDKPFAILVLCWYCNQYEVEDKAKWPETRQLALLRSKTPENFNLKAYNELRNPNAPDRITMEDIDLENSGGLL